MKEKKKKGRIIITLILFIIILGLGVYGFIKSEGLLDEKLIDDSNSTSSNNEVNSSEENSTSELNIILPTKSLYNLDTVTYENKTEYCLDGEDDCSKIYINADGKIAIYDSNLNKTDIDTSISSRVKYIALDDTCSGIEIVALTENGDLYISISNMGEEPDNDSTLSQNIFPFNKIETNYKFKNIWTSSWGIESFNIDTTCGIYSIYGLTTTNELRHVFESDEGSISIGDKRSDLIDYLAAFEIGSDTYTNLALYLSKYGYIQTGIMFEEKFYKNYVLNETNELVISKKVFMGEDNNLYIITTDNYLLKLDYNKNYKVDSSFIAKKVSTSKVKTITNNYDENITYKGDVIIKFENNKSETYEYINEFNLDGKY